MKKTLTRVGTVAGAALLLAGSLVACSSDTRDQSAPADEPTNGGLATADIVVANAPTLSNVNVYLGQSEGIFEEYGLTVENATLTAASDAIPQLFSGDWTFAMVDVATAIKAAQEDVGVVAVAPVQVGDPRDDGFVSIVTTPDSGIESLADLEGRTVQVNALGGHAEAAITASMSHLGVDPDTVNLVEIAPTEAIPALQTGRVDAISIGEPQITMALSMGLVRAGNTEKSTVPNIPTFAFIASKEFVAENPQVVRQFQQAIQEANVRANADHDLVLQTALSSTPIEEELLNEVTGFPIFGEEILSADQVQQYIDFMVENGLLDAADAPSGADVVVSLD